MSMKLPLSLCLNSLGHLSDRTELTAWVNRHSAMCMQYPLELPTVSFRLLCFRLLSFVGVCNWSVRPTLR